VFLEEPTPASRWADVPLPAAPFDIYRQLYREPMQLYQLWHEDRTAAAHSIENRVPFLDHRLVELLYSIPPELHRELFWDKQILRRAMRAELPPELCQREKVPFFYGDDVRYTQRILHRMLVAEGGTLVEEALAAASAAGGVLDGDQLRRIVAELPQDPDYKGAQLVLELVNMGLLSSMASQLRVDSAAALRVTPAPIAVREVADLAQWLQARAQSPTVAIDHDLSRIPAFADGILFVRCEGGDPSWSDPGSYYILRDQTLLFVIEASTGDWIRFLKQIDGRRSSAAILRQLDLAAGQIWKFLEEALEQRVLVWRDA
jgi:asparagine synthase (glutamine-hydrolysing)